MIRPALLLAMAGFATSALVQPLTMRPGETWLFTIDHGQPAKARKVVETASPARGEVKASVRTLFGTMMTITNNSSTGYTFQARLIGADGTAVTVRTCTLPPGKQPAVESWPQKAAGISVSDFKPAKGGRC